MTFSPLRQNIMSFSVNWCCKMINTFLSVKNYNVVRILMVPFPSQNEVGPIFGFTCYHSPVLHTFSFSQPHEQTTSTLIVNVSAKPTGLTVKLELKEKSKFNHQEILS